MSCSLPSAQAAYSIQTATARGGRDLHRGRRWGLRGLRIAFGWAVVTVALAGGHVTAQIVTQAGPLQPREPRAGSPASAQNGDGLRSLHELSVSIQPPSGDLPGDPAEAKFAEAGLVYHLPGTNRPWPLYSYWWEAPSVRHRPLYFEQVNLERYGYSCGVAQPLVSAAHFFGTIPALPYLMAVEPRCVYTLGHYRPGSCAPFHVYYPP